MTLIILRYWGCVANTIEKNSSVFSIIRDSKWNYRSLSWSTRSSRTCMHHGVCQLVAATSRRQLRSSDNFKRTIISTSSRLGDRAFIHCCRTATLEQSSHTRPSAVFDTGQLLPETENVSNCSRQQRLVTVVLGRCV